MEQGTILVVDDDQAIRLLLVEFLSEEGYEVYSATNGMEAIDQAKRHDPDHILMDLNMPELDGIDAIKCLKRDPETSEIPICAMSARSTFDWHGEELAADGTLGKPFDLQAVLDIVHGDASY
jgi:CheY-like chemotaxis protein